MYIEDRWTEEGVLGGAASNIGDSNLGWAGSSLSDGLLLRILLVLLPVPLSIVPLYNVSEKCGPGLFCCRSGGAYWPA